MPSINSALSYCKGVLFVLFRFTNARRRLVPRLLEAENARRARQGQPPLPLARKTWVPVEKAVFEKLQRDATSAIQQTPTTQPPVYQGGCLSAPLPHVQQLHHADSKSVHIPSQWLLLAKFAICPKLRQSF